MTDSDREDRVYTLGEIADYIHADVKGDRSVRIRGIRPLDAAHPEFLSFLTNVRFVEAAARCPAAAIIVSPDFTDMDRSLLITEQPYLALARVAQLFVKPPYLERGVHPSACVDASAELGEGAAVGALAQVGAGARVGARSRIYGSAYIGRNVSVGAGCLIYPGVVVLDDCVIGDNVIIHSGTVIGSDGFGFAQDEQGRHVKIPQVGRVRIDDDVEIGANCTIDRATFGETWVQRGAKIDNLVQLAHNVVVGEYSILIAQVGVAGSTKIGRHVVLAGQVGVVGHIDIGDGVRVGAKSGVSGSIKAGLDVSGSPAVPHKEWLQTCASMRRLSQMRDDMRQMQKQIRKLEERLNGE